MKLRVLFVCSMNQWRSPTAEALWKRSDEVEVQSRGLSPKARRTLREADLAWADLVFVMTHEQRSRLKEKHRGVTRTCEVLVLDIPDDYESMDPELVGLLKSRAGPEIDRVLAEIEGT